MQTQTHRGVHKDSFDPKTYASGKPFGGQEGSVCSNSRRLVGLETTLHLLACECMLVITCDFVMILRALSNSDDMRLALGEVLHSW